MLPATFVTSFVLMRQAVLWESVTDVCFGGGGVGRGGGGSICFSRFSFCFNLPRPFYALRKIVCCTVCGPKYIFLVSRSSKYEEGQHQVGGIHPWL